MSKKTRWPVSWYFDTQELGIRVEQHGTKGEEDYPISRKNRPRWETLFAMRHISDIRLAEFTVNVKGKKNSQELRKAPLIEIGFKYTAQPMARAIVPGTKDKEGEKMETDNDATEPPEADKDASAPANADDDEFGLPEPGNHGSAPPKADKDDLPMPEADTDEGIFAFDSEDPAQFPLASAFSDMPESGFEIRLIFRKPLVSRKPTTWYWAAACGLLVGLGDYKPQGTVESIKARRAWDFTLWVVSYGTNHIIYTLWAKELIGAN